MLGLACGLFGPRMESLLLQRFDHNNLTVVNFNVDASEPEGLHPPNDM